MAEKGLARNLPIHGTYVSWMGTVGWLDFVPLCGMASVTGEGASFFLTGGGSLLPVVTAESLNDRSRSWPIPTRGWTQVLRSSTPSHWPLGDSSPSPATTLCSEYRVGGMALRDRGWGTLRSSCQIMWKEKKEGIFESPVPNTNVGQCDSAAALTSPVRAGRKSRYQL